MSDFSQSSAPGASTLSVAKAFREANEMNEWLAKDNARLQKQNDELATALHEVARWVGTYKVAMGQESTTAVRSILIEAGMI